MKKEIVQLIEEAFADTAYPKSSDLVNSKMSEPQEVQSFFEGKKWQEISWQSLHKGMEYGGDIALIFMNNEAFHYFFPAFMLITIKNYEECDRVSDSTILKTTCSNNVQRNEQYINQRFEFFTLEQKKAIAHFLKYMVDVYGEDFSTYEWPGDYSNGSPQESLNVYWKKFL